MVPSIECALNASACIGSSIAVSQPATSADFHDVTETDGAGAETRAGAGSATLATAGAATASTTGDAYIVRRVGSVGGKSR